jgi:hypothetical protein
MSQTGSSLNWVLNAAPTLAAKLPAGKDRGRPYGLPTEVKLEYAPAGGKVQ